MSNPPPIPPTPMVYVSHKGKTWGPYDTAALQRHVDDCKFFPTDLANIVGSDNWQPLNTVASFPAAAQEVVIHNTEQKKKTGCITWGVLCVFILGFIGAIGECGGNSSSSSSSSGKPTVKASVSASQYVVKVTNVDDFEWQSTQLIVNGLFGYKYDHPYTIPVGDTITVKFNQFSKGDERLNPFTTKVNEVSVWVKGYEIPTFNVK